MGKPRIRPLRRTRPGRSQDLMKVREEKIGKRTIRNYYENIHKQERLMKEEEEITKPFVPALDLGNGLSSLDKGMRPTIVGAWKREKDKEGFAFFLDVQRRCGLSLVQVMSIVKGIWEEDDEAVSFSKDTEGRIVKFKLNPKKEKEEEVAKKQVSVKKEGLKIIKKGTGSKPVGKNVGKQQTSKPVKKLRTSIGKNGDNPF